MRHSLSFRIRTTWKCADVDVLQRHASELLCLRVDAASALFAKTLADSFPQPRGDQRQSGQILSAFDS